MKNSNLEWHSVPDSLFAVSIMSAGILGAAIGILLCQILEYVR